MESRLQSESQSGWGYETLRCPDYAGETGDWRKKRANTTSINIALRSLSPSCLANLN